MAHGSQQDLGQFEFVVIVDGLLDVPALIRESLDLDDDLRELWSVTGFCAYNGQPAAQTFLVCML